MPSKAQNTAIVAIGRNEGDRLKLCLQSLLPLNTPIVYVDSGSTDHSADYAESLHCTVVRLDPAQPFTAARARNAGFAAVLKHFPATTYIQFLDGDCELDPTWLPTGIAAIESNPDAAIVCGFVRELNRDATVYNMMCDIEWHQPAGEVLTSGGRFLIRAKVFAEAGGFRPDVIAAEDDEFCIRVRALGHKILNLDTEMARHDADMHHFSQWWRRARRSGHAYAQVASLHGSNSDRYFVADVRRIILYALAVPIAAIAIAPVTRGATLVLALAFYLMQYLRIYQGVRKKNISSHDASRYSAFTVLYKFPAMLGILSYYWRRRRGHAPAIIEYKGSTTSA